MTEVKSDHERAVDALYDLVGPMSPDRDCVSSGYLAEMAAKMITDQQESIDRLGALLEDYYEAGVILGLYGVKEDTSLPIGIIQALARAAYSQAPAQPPSTNAVDPVAQTGQEGTTRDVESSSSSLPLGLPTEPPCGCGASTEGAHDGQCSDCRRKQFAGLAAPVLQPGLREAIERIIAMWRAESDAEDARLKRYGYGGDLDGEMLDGDIGVGYTLNAQRRLCANELELLLAAPDPRGRQEPSV